MPKYILKLAEHEYVEWSTIVDLRGATRRDDLTDAVVPRAST